MMDLMVIVGNVRLPYYTNRAGIGIHFIILSYGGVAIKIFTGVHFRQAKERKLSFECFKTASPTFRDLIL